jgi:hypothetical protein
MKKEFTFFVIALLSIMSVSPVYAVGWTRLEAGDTWIYNSSELTKGSSLVKDYTFNVTDSDFNSDGIAINEVSTNISMEYILPTKMSFSFVGTATQHYDIFVANATVTSVDSTSIGNVVYESELIANVSVIMYGDIINTSKSYVGTVTYTNVNPDIYESILDGKAHSSQYRIGIKDELTSEQRNFSLRIRSNTRYSASNDYVYRYNDTDINVRDVTMEDLDYDIMFICPEFTHYSLKTEMRTSFWNGSMYVWNANNTYAGTQQFIPNKYVNKFSGDIGLSVESYWESAMTKGFNQIPKSKLNLKSFKIKNATFVPKTNGSTSSFWLLSLVAIPLLALKRKI